MAINPGLILKKSNLDMYYTFFYTYIDVFVNKFNYFIAAFYVSIIPQHRL